MDNNRNRKAITSYDKSIFNELSIICGCKTISTLQGRRGNSARSFNNESLLRCPRNRYAIITFKECQHVLQVHILLNFIIYLASVKYYIYYYSELVEWKQLCLVLIMNCCH